MVGFHHELTIIHELMFSWVNHIFSTSLDGLTMLNQHFPFRLHQPSPVLPTLWHLMRRRRGTFATHAGCHAQDLKKGSTLAAFWQGRFDSARVSIKDIA